MFWTEQSPADWGDAPQALGMQVAGGALEAVWTASGRTVRVTGEHDSEDYEIESNDGDVDEGTTYYTEFSAPLDPPLRMALEIVPRGIGRRLASKLGAGRGVAVGIPEVDGRYDIFCPDVAHASLVIGGQVAQVLVDSAAAGLFVTDRYVYTRHDGAWITDTKTIERDMTACGRLAAALLDARRAQQAPWERELAAGWGDFAAASALGFDPARALLFGELAGLRLEVSLSVDGDSLSTHGQVALPAALGLGLSVFHQQGGLMARAFRGQDVKTGVREFDDSFVVKGGDPTRVKALLQRPLIDGLLDLRRRSAEVALDDQVLKVRVDRGVLSTKRIAAMVHAMVNTAQGIRFEGPDGPGPYRG